MCFSNYLEGRKIRILFYIFIITVGALLGAKGRLSESFMGKLSHFQFISLLILLFIMGVNIGVNNDVVSNFYKIGLQAFILAVFSIVFSILFVKLVSRFLAKDGSVDEKVSD